MEDVNPWGQRFNEDRTFRYPLIMHAVVEHIDAVILCSLLCGR